MADEKDNGNGKNGRIIPLFGAPPEEPEELGATGEFPEGHLNEGDGGALQFGISHDADKKVVIMAFGKPVSWIAFQPESAEGIAHLLRSRAHILRERQFHRAALPELPTDPATRKAIVRQLMDHPLWSYPVEMRMPPEGESFFGEPSEEQEGRGVVPRLVEGPGWTDETPRVGGGFYEAVDIEFAYVNPTTESIVGGTNENDPRNSALAVWLEAGGWFDQSTDENIPEPDEGWNKYNKWVPSHDTRLNCGAMDMETALLELARLVSFFYNDDGSEKKEAPQKCEGDFIDKKMEHWQTGCTDAGDGFCRDCGFQMGWHEGTEDDDAPVD